VISWPSSLVSAIARRRAVILIGSGVSANAETELGQRPPTWGLFLENAYKKLGRRVPHIASSLKRYDYLEACDYLKAAHGAEWQNIVRASFSTPAYRHAPIHEAIFNLDCRIVASLNFDKIYENYAIPASEGTVVVKNYYDGDLREAVTGTDRYVIKPHGSVDTVSKIIFTLSDYAEARSKHANFYEIFNALLHTHTFLCVGVGLADPDLQIIFEDYRFKHGEFPHFMTVPSPVSEPQVDLIRRTRGLNVLKYSPKENHLELTESLQALSKAVSDVRVEIVKTENW